MEADNKDLVRTNRKELAPRPPYLDYFDSLNTLLEGIPPDDRGYLNVIVSNASQDTILRLLRLVSHYVDDETGYQDEIEVMDKTKLPEDLRDKRQQLNFETDAKNDLKKYPTNPELSDYMKVAVEEVRKSSTTPGAVIRVNNSIRYISDGTKWNIPEIKPALSEPSVAPKSSELGSRMPSLIRGIRNRLRRNK